MTTETTDIARTQPQPEEQESARDVPVHDEVEAPFTQEVVVGNYDKFSSDIVQLKAELASLEEARDHPRFLASGGISDVFRLDREDGSFVVRIPRREEHSEAMGTAVQRYIDALLPAHGDNALEQLVAGSPEEGAVVSERLEGTPGNQLTGEELAKLTDEQFGDVLKNFLAMQTKGFHIDRNHGNFLIDQARGVSMVDFHAAPGSTQTLPDKVTGFIGLINDGGIVDKVPTSTEDFSRLAQEKKLRNEVLARFRAICAEQQTDDSTDELMARLIKGNEETIKKYSDPEWVGPRLRVAHVVAAHFEDLGLDIVE